MIRLIFNRHKCIKRELVQYHERCKMLNAYLKVISLFELPSVRPADSKVTANILKRNAFALPNVFESAFQTHHINLDSLPYFSIHVNYIYVLFNNVCKLKTKILYLFHKDVYIVLFKNKLSKGQYFFQGIANIVEQREMDCRNIYRLKSDSGDYFALSANIVKHLN